MEKNRKHQRKSKPERQEDRKFVNQDPTRRNLDAGPKAHKDREIGRKSEEGLPIQGKRPAPEGLSRSQGSEADEDLLRKVEEEDAA